MTRDKTKMSVSFEMTILDYENDARYGFHKPFLGEFTEPINPMTNFDDNCCLYCADSL